MPYEMHYSCYMKLTPFTRIKEVLCHLDTIENERSRLYVTICANARLKSYL